MAIRLCFNETIYYNWIVAWGASNPPPPQCRCSTKGDVLRASHSLSIFWDARLIAQAFGRLEHSAILGTYRERGVGCITIGKMSG